MSTSASQLYSILSVLADPKDTNNLALAILKQASAIGSHPSLAYKYVSQLVRNVNEDLSVSFKDPLLSHLRRLMNPFQSLLTFTVYDKRVCDLVRDGGSLLASSNIEALLGVDAALQGKCERPNLEYSEDISDALDSVLENLSELGLPEHIDKIIRSRVEQVRAAVNSFQLYGVSGLNEAMEALLGSIEIYTTAAQKTDSKFKQFQVSALSAFLVITGSISAANAAFDEGYKLIENVRGSVEYIEDLRKSKKDDQTDNKSGEEE